MSDDTFGGGYYDAFVAQFDYFGGGHEFGRGIEYNATNNSVYVCWYTESGAGFPLVDNLNSNSINDDVPDGYSEGFITRFEFDAGMEWSTYFGGGEKDRCEELTVNDDGNVFITGLTEGDGFQDEEMLGDYFQEFLENAEDGGPHSDAYVVSLNSNDDLVWSTFFGGETYVDGENGENVSSRDEGWAITADQQNLFIGGRTESNSNFPWAADIPNYPFAFHRFWNSGGFDGFLSQFVLGGTPLSVEESESHTYSQVSVFPNPTNGILNVMVQGMDGPIKLDLHDAIGQSMVSTNFKITSYRQKLKLNLSGLTRGIYILTCSPADGSKSSVKVIIH